MIAKHIPMRTARKSNFQELVAYIADPQSKTERVGYVLVSNCHNDDPRAATLEILNTQAQNRRSEADKTYHLIVSFRAGEKLEDRTLQAIEAKICSQLGFGEHQRISAVHHDTDNLHMHIAINKIHPQRYTIHEPFNDYKILAKACQELELEYGLELDNHQVNRRVVQGKAADMEHHAGIESLLGWIHRECLDQIQTANSWSQLHHVLAQNSLSIQERGNGLIVRAQDGTSVKASSLGREFSKKNLQAKWGPFVPSQIRPNEIEVIASYQQKPIGKRIDVEELYAQYQAEMQAVRVNRQTGGTQIKDKRQRLIEAVRSRGRLKRAFIKTINMDKLAKKLLYAATHQTLKKSIEKINQRYRRETMKIAQKGKSKTWADWLRDKATQGDLQALRALRDSPVSQGLKGNLIAGPSRKNIEAIPAAFDSITKEGTVIYCQNNTVIRDDGRQIRVSRGDDPQGLQTALEMAARRYGPRLELTGTEKFKQQMLEAAVACRARIEFSDAQLERQRVSRLHLVTTNSITNNSI